MTDRPRLDQLNDDTLTALYDQRDRLIRTAVDLRAERGKLIRWHAEDGEQLAEMRGTIERLRAELDRDRAELARLTEAESADAAAGSYAHRAERAEAERDQHAGLVRRAEAYLAATHQHTARHDVLGENSSCAGCELLDRIRTALAGPAKPLAQPTDGSLCRCGHTRNQHQDNTGLGGAQCRVCPGDEERSWRHPYTPTEGSAR